MMFTVISFIGTLQTLQASTEKDVTFLDDDDDDYLTRIHVFVLFRFIYGETLRHLTAQTAIDLMHAANKYELVELTERCRTYFLHGGGMTYGNVCWLFEHASLLNEHKIRKQ